MGDSAAATMDTQSHGQSTISTIYLNGFPDDTREREIHNMLKFFMGFTDAVLNRTDKGVVAFAKFEDPQAAMNACNLLDNYQFDLDHHQTLRCSIAKRDMEVRENRGAGTKREHPRSQMMPGHMNMPPPQYHQPQHFAQPTDYAGHGGYGGPPGGYMGAEMPFRSPGYGAQQPQHGMGMHQGMGMGGYPMAGGQFEGHKRQRTAPYSGDQGGGRNDTICLRNLSEHVTEHNLREFMHQVDGYVGLHFINKSGNPLCFVKLESVESADMAIQSLEGRVLPGGDNAIRAEPAKRSLSLDPTTYAIRN